jgi:hypothetical protein
VIADIHVNHPDVTSDFGVHVDVLKRLELAGNRQSVGDGASFDTCDGCRNGARIASGVAWRVGFGGTPAQPKPR